MNTPLQDIRELISIQRLVPGQDYKFDKAMAIIYLRASRLFAELPDKDCAYADRWFTKLTGTTSYLGSCRMARFKNSDSNSFQSPALMLNAGFLSDSDNKNTTA